jgi:imidazole glycerol-phosphate synthase subunit HisH
MMKRIVGVVALKSSNYKSVIRAFSYLGYTISSVTKPSEILACSHLVIPGVSTFGSVVSELHQLNMFDVIQELIGSDIKILGLCAGMQIMGESSAESPQISGLSWFDFQVRGLSNLNGKRVFHTGWNSTFRSQSEMTGVLLESGEFYFNHSFFVSALDSPSKLFTFTPFMGESILSSFQYLNIKGIQFHPEKSQVKGLTILDEFAQW